MENPPFVNGKHIFKSSLFYLVCQIVFPTFTKKQISFLTQTSPQKNASQQLGRHKKNLFLTALRVNCLLQNSKDPSKHDGCVLLDAPCPPQKSQDTLGNDASGKAPGRNRGFNFRKKSHDFRRFKNKTINGAVFLNHQLYSENSPPPYFF